MFSPSQADVRRFFFFIYAKAQAGQPLEAIGTIASLWIDEHPEYHAHLSDDDRLTAVRLVGEALAADWLLDLMVGRESVAPLRKWLLAPVRKPPTGKAMRGKVICNCFDVSEDTIVAAFCAGESLDALQARTRCGTNCGSCVPELKRMQHATPTARAAA